MSNESCCEPRCPRNWPWSLFFATQKVIFDTRAPSALGTKWIRSPRPLAAMARSSPRPWKASARRSRPRGRQWSRMLPRLCRRRRLCQARRRGACPTSQQGHRATLGTTEQHASGSEADPARQPPQCMNVQASLKPSSLCSCKIQARTSLDAGGRRPSPDRSCLVSRTKQFFSQLLYYVRKNRRWGVSVLSYCDVSRCLGGNLTCPRENKGATRPAPAAAAWRAWARMVLKKCSSERWAERNQKSRVGHSDSDFLHPTHRSCRAAG